MPKTLAWVVMALVFSAALLRGEEAPAGQAAARDALAKFTAVESELGKKPDKLKASDKNRYAEALLEALLSVGTNAQGFVGEKEHLGMVEQGMQIGAELMVRASYRSDEWIAGNWKALKKSEWADLRRLTSEERKARIGRFIARVRFFDYFVAREVDILAKYVEKREVLNDNENGELAKVKKEMDQMKQTLEKLDPGQLEAGWEELFSLRRKELQEEAVTLQQHLEKVLSDFSAYLTEWRKRVEDLELNSASWIKANEDYKTESLRISKEKTALETEIRRVNDEMLRIDSWLSMAR